MAQFNPFEVVYGGYKRQYYVYDGELYSKHFPISWAETHEPGTGPKECSNCQEYGCWNGVFIGYCANCAPIIYEGGRGCGFISWGEERTKKEGQEDWIRAFDTYLSGVNLDDIGDTDFYDSRMRVENDFHAYYEEIGEEYLNTVFKDEYYDDEEDDELNYDSDISADDDDELKEKYDVVVEAKTIENKNVSVSLVPDYDESEDDDEDDDIDYYGWDYLKDVPDENGIGFSYGYGSNYNGGYDSF